MVVFKSGPAVSESSKGYAPYLNRFLRKEAEKGALSCWMATNKLCGLRDAKHHAYVANWVELHLYYGVGDLFFYAASLFQI